MPQAQYTVDLHEGVWNVSLLGRRFGPYSSMDTAMLAAMNAARKAEAMGYQAMVVVKSDEETPEPADAETI
jgi:hypothetical protein